MNIIDTRDLIEEANQLREYVAGDAADEEEIARLAAIDALEAEGIAEWNDGAQLIAEDDFTEYAQELAEDIGAIDSDASWPLYCIDWERAARDLQQDYSAVEFDGTTYYVRS